MLEISTTGEKFNHLKNFNFNYFEESHIFIHLNEKKGCQTFGHTEF